MDSLKKNYIYDLVKLTKAKRTEEFRLKQDDNTAELRYKTRLVVKGFNQKK